MTVHPAFDIAVGSMRLRVPAGARAVPGLLWGNLAMAGLMEAHGYDEVAKDTLLKLEGWLRTPESELSWPGEGEKRVGRKLIDGVKPEDAGLRWYAVRSATRREGRAEQSLLEVGLVVYLPRYTRWRRHAGRKEKIEQALLGGYMFVGVRAEEKACAQDLQSITNAEGVHAVVKFTSDRAPLPLPFGQLVSILKQELDGDFDRTGKKRSKDPERGTLLKLIGGKFSGFPARFMERTEDDRVKVMFQLFGRESPMLVKPEDLEGLDPEG